VSGKQSFFGKRFHNQPVRQSNDKQKKTFLSMDGMAVFARRQHREKMD
jgi:hypothetical protein